MDIICCRYLFNLKVSYPEDWGFFSNRGISVISVVLRETTLTILDSTGEPVSMESEIVKVVSLSTTGNIRDN